MNLQDFLNKSESINDVTKNVVVGDRFKDENGEDFSFTIKALAGKDLSQTRTLFRKIDSKGNFKFDDFGFNTKIVVECTVCPDFKDAASIKERKVNTPEEYVQDVLKAGEIEALAEEIKAYSGFGTNINDLIKEAKN